jgi:uncharacterized membrane protein YphA (DoxX/SURF4 family)
VKHSLVISSYFLAAIFLFAGFDKVYHYEGFINALNSYSLIPRGGAQLLAMPLILAEICTGLGLAVASWRRHAAFTATALLALFTVALTVNHFIRPGSICGCWFTLTLAKGTKLHILQNLVLLGLSISIWYDLSKGRQSGAVTV